MHIWIYSMSMYTKQMFRIHMQSEIFAKCTYILYMQKENDPLVTFLEK